MSKSQFFGRGLLPSGAHCRFPRDSVFNGYSGNYSESDAPAPLNVYVKTKWLAEQEVLKVHPLSLIARVTFYGWNVQKKQSLAEWILDGLSAGKKMPGFTDAAPPPNPGE